MVVLIIFVHCVSFQLFCILLRYCKHSEASFERYFENSTLEIYKSFQIEESNDYSPWQPHLEKFYLQKIFITALIFTKMISFACAFAVFLLLFLNTSEWLLPTITVIFPLSWIFFEKKQRFNINLLLMIKRLSLISDSWLL